MIIVNYIFICLIFGTTFLAIKFGIESGVSPLFSAGIRFTLAGLIVILYFLLKGVNVKKFIFSKRIMYIGFCLTFMTFSTLYWAEQYITSGLAAVLSATGPMMILLFQLRRDNKGIERKQLIALLMAFAGVIFVCLPGISQHVSYLWVAACIAVLLGEAFYGFGSISSKEILTEYSTVSPFLINAFQMLYGGIFLLFVSFLIEKPKIESLSSWDAVWPILYLVFIGSIGGHGLYSWLLSKTNPVFPSTWLYVSPLIASVLGYFVMDEPIKPIMAIGGILILSGVFIANWSTFSMYRKQGRLLKKEVNISK
ncbi:DMT family transporter [Gottfriedia acidiceleris]|uniref:EamA family transporter n=1 Tax=Gottfriedia acidiceleris TaxID=371036 RepID=A0ABY4JM08_9BACI|nr:EamA family transporter [Gottfriedia acidiceleris]UPM54885.1 EamA family transporter [Gottfriedia acidiceleris]